ncbi:nuclear transport factor 2 family protein [Variovorax sp. NFACC27]|jgi:hypothetical protein|uniref:Nuclear transport factor 2 family protein n=1 Tax=Variovorax gossypii TaxID=1679495 RepID=A0A431TJA0_9BURK|nr:hypothetical protein [Variovorax gossypii]MDP9606490.1 hypothetical protein [Variovorax paradoxus]SEF33645.1 hypothetical protein SAMN03159371_06660 [Variovorax sp. NFACC28]SEG96601.1 hypothetical protein SAMN03159365_06616 [Variovorax sp. NFACC29]SFE07435.1 hypothetical protein SAMN03159379_07219 [Variovorax sp. NFACC26]SFH14253.1 hypothetical protein SAMN03159447_06885 [Variovorax sp. NFACC27]
MEQDDQASASAPYAPLGQAALRDFFLRYGREFNEGLAGRLNRRALSDLYAEAFIASAPAGVVIGRNDSEFARATSEGFRRYQDTGMKRMELEGVTVSSIDALHAIAHAAWNAVYTVEGGEKSIRFTNTYLLRLDALGALRVFGWITGDEEEAMRKHGIGDRPTTSS